MALLAYPLSSCFPI